MFLSGERIGAVGCFSWAERWRRSGTFGKGVRCDDRMPHRRRSGVDGRPTSPQRIPGRSRLFRAVTRSGERVNGAALRGERSGACARSRFRRCVLRLLGWSRRCVLQCVLRLWCGSGVGLGGAFCGCWGGPGCVFCGCWGGPGCVFCGCGAAVDSLPVVPQLRSRGWGAGPVAKVFVRGLLCEVFSAGGFLREVFCATYSVKGDDRRAAGVRRSLRWRRCNAKRAVRMFGQPFFC